jgi:hypothetical protein
VWLFHLPRAISFAIHQAIMGIIQTVTELESDRPSHVHPPSQFTITNATFGNFTRERSSMHLDRGLRDAF